MNKFFAVFAFLAVLGGAAAQNDLHACLNDIVQVAHLVEKLYNDVQAKNLSAIIEDIQAAIPLVNKTIHDCSHLNPRPMVNVTNFKDMGKCLQDIIALIPLVQKTINDIKAGNLTAILADIEALIPAITTTLKDCSNATTTTNFRRTLNFHNSTKCWASVKQTKMIFQLTKMGGMRKSNVLIYGSQLVASAAKTLEHCTLTPVSTANLYSFLDLGKTNSDCKDELIAVVLKLGDIISDLISGKTTTLITDLVELIQDAQNAIHGCLHAKDIIGNLMSKVDLSFINQNDMGKCLQDIIALIPLVQKTINDIKAGNLTAILADIEALIPAITNTLKDCANVTTVDNGKCVLKQMFTITEECKSSFNRIQGAAMSFFFLKDEKSAERVVDAAMNTFKLCVGA